MRPALRALFAIALAGAFADAQVPRPVAARRRASAADSAALVSRVRDEHFLFTMRWRYLWQADHALERAIHHYYFRLPQIQTPGSLQTPWGRCNAEMSVRHDVGPREWMAHLAKADGVGRVDGICPTWLDQRYPETPDVLRVPDAPFLDPRGTWKTSEQQSIMVGFLKESGDSAQRLRGSLLRLLDSAARVLPGDSYIAGQRVRFHADQQDYPAALRAAKECEAEHWWCFALTGYVQWLARDNAAATTTFDQARKVMPDSIRCAWDDISELLQYSAKTEYRRMSCAQRAAINSRAWWLADPLFVEKGNDRRVEHYGRRTLIALHRAIEIDGHFDWRENYQGPWLEIMVMRWGWPVITSIALCPQTDDPDVEEHVCPMAWRTRNTKALPLHDETAKIHYQGPQYHLLPTWATIKDPFTAADTAWDIAPPREMIGIGGSRLPFWDQSWWALEFYRRDAPLVPLLYQLAFFRRQQTAIMAAGMSWDSLGYTYRAPNRVLAAALLGNSPEGQLYGVRDTMTVSNPHAMAAAVPSGPALLGLEMVPRDASGTSGRTRLGVTVPRALSALPRGELALSDPVLTRAFPGVAAPTSADDMLPLMLGSTRLRNPQRVGVFWELYGLNRGDTIDVAVKLIRRDDANVAERLATLMGVRGAGDDSLVVTWKEPRPGDVITPVANGVSIAPRSVTLNLAAMAQGHYTLEIIVQRGAAPPVTSRREFFIER
jgi:hypothetical protein